MQLITTDHIYYIGMINTLLNVNGSTEGEENHYSSTYVTANRLKIITKIDRRSIEEKYDGLGLYPIHISVYKGMTIIGNYDSTVKLSDEVLASIDDSDVLTDEKNRFIFESKPTIVEKAQNYLRHRHQIDESDSNELFCEAFKLFDIAKQLVINNSNDEPFVKK